MAEGMDSYGPKKNHQEFELLRVGFLWFFGTLIWQEMPRPGVLTFELPEEYSDEEVQETVADSQEAESNDRAPDEVR